MKIVVLDGYTLNPGDLSWEGLRSLGDCYIYDRTSSREVVERAGGAQIALTNKTISLSPDILDRENGKGKTIEINEKNCIPHQHCAWSPH